MRHPIITFIGYILCYGLFLYATVIVGMVIGTLINDELAQRKWSGPLWYQLPNRDLVPPPDMFPGLT
jgi:hypothetical protein